MTADGALGADDPSTDDDEPSGPIVPVVEPGWSLWGDAEF